MGLVIDKTERLLPEQQVIFMRAQAAGALIYPARPEYVTQINLTLRPGANREEVRRGLESYLGTPYKVQTLEATFETVRDVAAGLELGFAIGGIGALVVGLFLVYNVLSVSVAERRHDIGILRALGATRGQIRGLFAVEALTFGAIGSALGVVVGLGLAQLSLGTVQQVLQQQFAAIDLQQLTITPGMVLMGMAAGMAAALIASLAPAATAADASSARAASSWQPRLGTKSPSRTGRAGVC